jgi:hypothetical protein
MAARKAEERKPARHVPQEEEDDEQEQQRQCLLCGEIPESIICLACDHCVDIPCAAKILLQNQKDLNSLNLSEIQCLVCEKVTHLSEEVQATLVEYLQSEAVEFDMNGEEQEGEEEGEELGRGQNDQESNKDREEAYGEEEEIDHPQMRSKAATKIQPKALGKDSGKKISDKSGSASRSNKRLASAQQQHSTR